METSKTNAIVSVEIMRIGNPLKLVASFTKTSALFMLIFGMMMLNALSAHGQTVYYVRAEATGAKTGSDWNNAFSSLPSTLIRGATYYIADGSYGNCSISAATAASTYIFIKKATVLEHGTDTGWQNSYGDGQATFSYLNIQTSYIDFDGVVGQLSSNLSGYVTHGFKVANTNAAANSSAVKIGASGNIVSYVTIKHTEITNLNTPRTGTWYKDSDHLGVYCHYLSLKYVWSHDAPGANMTVRGGSYGTVDHCVFGKNGHGQIAMNWSESDHSEIFAIHPWASNWVIKNSYFHDWRSTGNWVFFGANSNWIITGNVVFTTGYWSIPSESGDSDGVFQACMHGDQFGACQNNRVVNNTFANIPYGGRIASMADGSIAGLKIENNLFYNVKVNSTQKMELANSSFRKNNSYYDCGPVSSETGQEIRSGNPFVNSSKYDFRLAIPTSDSSAFESPYNFDMAMNKRGNGGIWDRGAFEYVNNSDQNETITAPKGVRIN